MSSFEEQSGPYSKGVRAIVFADLCGSSKLFERVGNDRALQIVGRALEVLSDVTVRHRGLVIKTIGDEVMATFADAVSAAEAASAMHKAVKADPMLAEIGASIKVGLHIGEVILEKGDVYGDAVNVAARMVGLAKPDQIMATQETAERLPPAMKHATRRLGEARVRGKALPIELCELVWQEDTEQLTMIGAMPWSGGREEGEGGRLILEYGSYRRVVEAQGPSFQMGRGEDNDLVIPEQGVSRTHATVEFRKGFFVLADRSTNGTYIRMGAELVFLHRDQTHLLKEGVISLGRTPANDPAGVIRYRCE
jgi:class 3 adenylate cyclase